MSVELSKEQRLILNQTGPVDTPAEFQTLLAAAKPRMAEVVREVQEPNQSVAVTLTELRDIALTVKEYRLALEKKSYGPEKVTSLMDAIRLAASAQAWFGEGVRNGDYRARSIGEIVEASRPWRARLKAMGEHAFAFDQEIAEQFGDVNSTGTLEEEVADIDMLLKLVEQHRSALDAVGMSESFVQEGKTLYEEATGRDLAGILGVRNRAEATDLRNRILTFATQLGREARAAGVNACFDDPTARRRFEAASFREALRSVRTRRSRSPKDEPNAREPAGPAAVPSASPTDATPTKPA